MGKKFKPIYVCDLCGKEFEDPNEVRLFKGNVLNGEETALYVNTKKHSMSCIDCLPKLLIDNYELVSNLETKIEETLQTVEQVKTPEINPTEIFKEESTPSQELETEKIKTVEEIVNEIVEENDTELDDLYLDDGKFLLLYKINDEEIEKEAARSYGYNSLTKLRETLGRSIINTYISTNRYTNELPEKVTIKEVETINKIIFGIPNIVKRQVFISDQDDQIAYIEKNKFNLQLEPATTTSEMEKDKKTKKLTNKEEVEIQKSEKIEEQFFKDFKDIFDEIDEDDIL